MLQGPGSLENLTASFDWYDIEITDAIAPLNSLFAHQQCFNFIGTSNPTLSYTGNPYCALILRNTSSGDLVGRRTFHQYRYVDDLGSRHERELDGGRR